MAEANWRRREVEIRAQLYAQMLSGRGVVLFHDFPRSRWDFWRNAYVSVEVLAIFPKDEWPRLKQLLRKSGWGYNGGEKLVVYFGKGRRMMRTLVVRYGRETESEIYPFAGIWLIWCQDEIMLGVTASRFKNGYPDMYSFELEQYGVNRTYATLLLDECKRARIPHIRLAK